MQFIKCVEVSNFRNLKYAKLDDFTDLNIIIGPNNCGKTSMLNAINTLNTATNTGGHFVCNSCRVTSANIKNLEVIILKINNRDKYLGKEKVELTLEVHKKEIEKLLPEYSEKLESIIKENPMSNGHRIHLETEFEKEKTIFTETSNLQLMPKHISPLIWNEFKKTILDKILFCPDERLQNYKGKSIKDHIYSKNLPATEQSKLIDYLAKFVDPSLSNIRYNLDLIRTIENINFDTTIEEQGSGVKSLICLVLDIISEKETKILLIDEPELGLNPLGRHSLFKFLLQQCKEKQVFLATHDPTFVNPILWNQNNVSIYLYSFIAKGFVKINLEKNKQDPNTFAGFLPHTTSLKKIHLYVEGTSDVYTFQIFLNEYLKRFNKGYQIQNKIGIYHLAGSFWCHLLHTIPKSPFMSLVVLDGDKIEESQKILEKYSTVEKERFQFFDRLTELETITPKKRSGKESPCPIYCLQRSKLEEYLTPQPRSKDKCPSVARKMDKIPQEFEWIFDILLRWTGRRIAKPSERTGKQSRPK